jgi:hypothetical protein
MTDKIYCFQDADEALAEPLNATFCVAPVCASRLPSLTIPTRAPVERTNLLPPPTVSAEPLPVKKARISPIVRNTIRPSVSTTPRLSVGRVLTSAGKRQLIFRH